jgi:hypothetical protein
MGWKVLAVSHSKMLNGFQLLDTFVHATYSVYHEKKQRALFAHFETGYAYGSIQHRM